MAHADATAPDELPLAARRRLAEAFGQLCLDAATAIMRVYGTGCRVWTKDDSSPVSEADEMAEAIILAGLPACAPGIPVLAEEAASRGDKPDVDGRFILVDPLDGTREFLGRNGEFTVNIALIEHGVARVGAVYAPALNRLWFAGDNAFVCTIEPGGDLDLVPVPTELRTRPAPAGGLVVMASRSHADPQTEQFLATLPIAERRTAGSSLKFCALAEGQADVYPRFGPTMEWDTAAGDAVLRAAGGVVLSTEGGDLGYGKHATDFRNGGFVAWGRRSDAERLGPAGTRERHPS